MATSIIKRRQEQSRLRSAQWRQRKRLNHDLNAAIADALVALKPEDGKVSALPWKEVLRHSVEGLRARGYKRPVAVDLLRERLTAAVRQVSETPATRANEDSCEALRPAVG